MFNAYQHRGKKKAFVCIGYVQEIIFKQENDGNAKGRINNRAVTWHLKLKPRERERERGSVL